MTTSLAPPLHDGTDALPSAGHRPPGITIMLRAEGAAAFGAALASFAALEGSWTLFALLLLLPDLAMVGYSHGPRVGARLYNAAHTYLAPALLAALGHGLGLPLLLPLACIWVAHIGMDRALGYGLKHETGFGHTHLGWR